MASVGGSVRMAQASNYIIQGSKFDDLLVYTATSNQSIVFGASNSSNMLFKIASNGFVGVGVSNPGFKLDVAGDLNFSGTLRQGGVPYVGSQWSNNTSNVFLIGSNVGIGLSNAGAALHVACNVRVDGALQLSSYAQFGGVDLMYGSGAFSNAGGVILTTSNIQGYSNLVWGASGSNGTMFSIMSNTSNDGFRWVSGAASNSLMTLTGEGRLGIGAAVPVSMLHLGTALASNVMVTLCNAATGARPASIGLSNGGEVVVATSSNSGLVLLTSNVERMRVTSNGFIGIGTAAPGHPLELSSATDSFALINASAGIGQAGLKILAGNGTTNRAARLDFLNAVSSTSVPRWTIINDYSQTGSNDLNFVNTSVPNGGRMMTLTQGGNVGIGNISPAYTLDVNGYTRTKTVAFLAYCYGGPTVANAAGWFLVPMNNTTYNYNATLSIPYNGNQPGNIGCPWTVTVTGVYDIKIKVTCGTGGWITNNVGYSVNNASSVGVQSSVYVGSSVGSFTQVFNVNDVVRVWYYQSGGSGYMNSWGDSTTTFFACTLLAAL